MRLLLCIGVWPVTFLAVLFGWRQVDLLQGRQEVAAFVQTHQTIVDQRRSDPRVYSFNLAPDPEDDSRLLIEWDVADLETYLTLDDDVSKWITLSQAPKFHCTLRSQEELPNDFGAMAFGIGELGEVYFRLKAAAAIATLAMLAILAGFLVARWLWKKD